MKEGTSTIEFVSSDGTITYEALIFCADYKDKTNKQPLFDFDIYRVDTFWNILERDFLTKPDKYFETFDDAYKYVLELLKTSGFTIIDKD